MPPIDPPKAPLAVESGLITPTTGWIANGLGLYLTSDAGHTWKIITPKPLVGDDAVGRLQQLVALNPTHLWMSIGGVGLPGGRCINGSCRGSAIESTTNGGRTWRLTYLPGCLSCSGTVSFLNSRRGFAVGLATTSKDVRAIARTYVTVDGGRTWVSTSNFIIPFGAIGDSLTFVSSNDGWLTASDLSTAALYRTTDGGRRWTRSLLSATSNKETVLSLFGPTFFGKSDGIVGAAVEVTATRLDHDVIYSTSNGGRSWSTINAPDVVVNSHINQDGNLSVNPASPTTWYLVAGDRLYVTRNGERTWSWRVPAAGWARGAFQASAPDFITPEIGWADFLYNSCGGMPRKYSIAGRCVNLGGLAATTTGGRSWTLVSDPTN